MPLMLAARFNEMDVVEFVLERGASLTIQDHKGNGPIHHVQWVAKQEISCA